MKQAHMKPLEGQNRPEFSTNLAENPHKLSKSEVLQRKMAHKSKNHVAAREELRKKQEAL